MRQIIAIPLCSMLLVTFLVTGVEGQRRKGAPRRTSGRATAAQAANAGSIFEALNSGDVAQAEALLKKNPALANARDEVGQTPLHIAALMGDAGLVELLLEKMNDVNATDEAGATALHLAAQSGHKEVAEVLLAGKANVNARDGTDQTPLHFAVTPDPSQLILDPSLRGTGGVSDDSNRLELIKFLLDNKADVNAKDSTGKTPLHVAAAFGSTEIVQLLIDGKADVNARDIDGRTPLGAVENYIKTIDLLRRHGGK
jgi:ankyrin repeat protein